MPGIIGKNQFFSLLAIDEAITEGIIRALYDSMDCHCSFTVNQADCVGALIRQNLSFQYATGRHMPTGYGESVLEDILFSTGEFDPGSD